MESDSANNLKQEICWFCKKGRHSECMKKIPIDVKSDGPHDFHLIPNWLIVNVPININNS